MEPPPPKLKKRVGFIVPLGLAIAFVFMGADFTAISLRPLEYLGIPFPSVLKYAHVIVPAVAFSLWFVARRSTILSSLIFIATLMLLPIPAQWADGRPVKIHVTKEIDGITITSLETRLGFKVRETGDASGEQLWVDRTPGREQALTAEAKRLGIYRP